MNAMLAPAHRVTSPSVAGGFRGSVDAKVEWLMDGLPGRFDLALTGASTLRERSVGLFVLRGQTLARLPMVSMSEGTVCAGSNIEINFDGVCRAAMDGRVSLRDGVLAVDEVHVLEAKAYPSSAYMRHNGALIVEGRLQHAASIDVTGDLEVYGDVECARLNVGGDLIVDGGIIGPPSSAIQVKGNVYAKFIVGAVVRAGGDICVEQEIDRSLIQCRGALDISGGRVTASTIEALRGMDVGEAGAPRGVGPVLTAGCDYALAGRLRDLHTKLWRQQFLLNQMAALRETGNDEKHEQTHCTADETLLAEYIEGITHEIQRLEDNVRTIRDESARRSRNRIVIHTCMYEGTRLCIGADHMLADTLVTGPVYAIVSNAGIKTERGQAILGSVGRKHGGVAV